MLFLLSPAKSLDYESQRTVKRPTTPQFVEQSSMLIDILQSKSVAEIAALMDLSEPLAALNVARYAAWSETFNARNSRPAVLAFNGDVYEGLQASSLSDDDLAWAQTHVAILSGLYGVLRPLDRMQPYRLEMGTALVTPRGRTLYAFWGDVLAEYLNAHARKASRPGGAPPVIVNLASQEYFKAVKRPCLSPRVLQCVFEDWKDGRYKVISFFAKRARGLMARYAIQHRLTEVAQLQAFNSEGYAFDAASSTEHEWVFRRRVTSVNGTN